MDIAIMIEGQDGLNWPRWKRIVRAVEDLGFAGLYRSDHFTNASGPEKDSLDLWVSFTWLAGNTRRIEFGSMVSPVSFRDPILTARMAMQVNDLSANDAHPAGRLRLGLGAGWNIREHAMFGYNLFDLPKRFERFKEGLEVITRLMHSSQEPANFTGVFYQIKDAVLLPAPVRPGGPPIVIGGNGPQLTLPLVARYAQEWNAVGLPLDRFTHLNPVLDKLLREAGREPSAVRRTLMTTVLFGRGEAELNRKLNGQTPAQLHENGILYGASAQLNDQLHQLQSAGAQRVMLRWEDMDDMDGLEALASAVLPEFPSG